MTGMQEPQYRHQYSTDGRDGMAWQPTAVWRANARKRAVSRTLSVEEWIDCLLFVTAIAITIVAYHFVSNIGFIEHLPNLLRGILLIGAILVSFMGSVKILYSEIVKAFVQLIVCGVFTLCVGCIVLPIIWHLL